MTWVERFFADTPANWIHFQRLALLLVAILSPALAYAGTPPWVQVIVSCAGAGAAFAAQFTVDPNDPNVKALREVNKP